MVWSPPDKAFSINVPVTLKDAKTTYKDTSHSGYKTIKLFGGKKSGYVFVVYDLDLVEEATKRSLEDKLGGLEFVLGGDDDYEFVETYIKIGGLDARQIVYANQNKKGLIIDAGGRIYILGLSTKDRKDLDSAVAERFFTSFRLLNEKK